MGTKLGALLVLTLGCSSGSKAQGAGQGLGKRLSPGRGGPPALKDGAWATASSTI